MGSPIAFLMGGWRGTGRGEYPTMESFDYEEEIRFIDVGVPALIYQQRAWSPGDGGILHIETGIWRPSPDGRLAVSIALPRVSEISEGRVGGDSSIRLATTSVRRAEGGAGLVAVRREYDRRGDDIDYRILMATEGVEEVTLHLTGVLRRTSEG